MLTFVIVGAVGLVVLLVSVVFDDLLDIADGTVSGASLGAGAVGFGAIGAIVTANGLPTVWAYGLSLVFGALVMFAIGKFVARLKETEDGAPRDLVGMTGTVTSAVGPGRGEVSLDDPTILERRLAFADADIPEGTRIVVTQAAGTRVKVAPES